MKDYYIKEACSKACKEKLISFLDLSPEVLSYIEDKVFEPVEGYKFKFHSVLKFSSHIEIDSVEHSKTSEIINYLNNFKNCKAEIQHGLKYSMIIDNNGYNINYSKFGIAGIEIMVW